MTRLLSSDRRGERLHHGGFRQLHQAALRQLRQGVVTNRRPDAAQRLEIVRIVLYSDIRLNDYPVVRVKELPGTGGGAGQMPPLQ